MTLRLTPELRAPLRTVLGFSLVINLALLAPSIFMLQVFDRVLATGSVETLVVMGLIAFFTLALMGALDYLRARVLAGSSVLLEQRHGPALLAQMLRASAQDSTRAYADGMRDLATLRAFLTGPGVIALCDAPWTVVYLGLIFLFHPALGLMATGCAVFLLLLAVLNERLTRPTILLLQDATRQTGRFVDSAVRRAEVVAALGMQDAVTQRWQGQAGVNHVLQLRMSRRGGLVTSVGRVSRQFVQVLMLGYGAYLVIHDHATAGVMLATTIILARALAPVEILIGSWRGLVEARAAYGRLDEVLNRPIEGAVGTELPRPKGQLSVEAVSYTPPGAGRALLRGVNLRAEPGQVLAIVGASGSGKTTLVRLLVGVTRPSEGTVRIDGADIRNWDPVRLGSWMGYVPQDVALFDGTISENIARLGTVDSEAVLAAAGVSRTHELFLRMPQGYDTRVGEGGARLSGGQRQRVALARAVYGLPPIVVLDEPDASLDAEGEHALLETLRDLKGRGTTVIVVTQRRGVLSLADQVLMMKDGELGRLARVEGDAPRAIGNRDS